MAKNEALFDDDLDSDRDDLVTDPDLDEDEEVDGVELVEDETPEPAKPAVGKTGKVKVIPKAAAKPKAEKKAKPAEAKAEKKAAAKPKAEKKTTKAAAKANGNDKAKSKTNGKAKAERKGRQTPWEKWQAPSAPGTLLRKAYDKALRPEGVKLKALEIMLEEEKTSKKGGKWVIGFLRRGWANGVRWKTEIENGTLFIKNPRPDPKAYQKFQGKAA